MVDLLLELGRHVVDALLVLLLVLLLLLLLVQVEQEAVVLVELEALLLELQVLLRLEVVLAHAERDPLLLHRLELREELLLGLVRVALLLLLLDRLLRLPPHRPEQLQLAQVVFQVPGRLRRLDPLQFPVHPLLEVHRKGRERGAVLE